MQQDVGCESRVPDPRSRTCVKGLGAYVSGYLMTDVGQRVVRDLRNRLFRHILGPVGGVLRPADDRASCCRGSPTTSTRSSRPCRRRSATWCASRWRSSATPALLFYYDWRLALVVPDGARRSSCIRSSGSGQRVRRTTRRSQEQLEHLSHIAAEAFTGHRIVKAFGAEAREAARFSRRVAAAVPHEHEGHERAVGAAAAHGVPRRRWRRSAALWYGSQRDRGRPADAGRVHRRSSPRRS